MGLFKKEETFGKICERHSVMAIIFGVLGVALGILCCLFALPVRAAIMWVIIGLVGVMSIAAIVSYFLPKTYGKETGAFILAILALICIVILIILAATHKPVQVEGEVVDGFTYVTLQLIRFFSIFFGIVAMVSGVYHLCCIGEVVKGQRGFAIFSAIIGIILGILMVVFPFVMQTLATIFAGIYVIIVSISAIILGIKAMVDRKKTEQE